MDQLPSSLRMAFLLTFCLALAGCGKNSKSQGLLDVNQSGSLIRPMAKRVKNLAELQKFHSSAILSPQPWVGYWWPYVGSGIANGLRDPENLSPADKYDAAYKRFLRSQGKSTENYQAAADWERAYHGPGLAHVASWWGHCNGWAASALMIPEPDGPKIIQGVRFDVRDQKALLAESWMEFSGDFLGNRVDSDTDFSSAAFWDVVPAQFHLLLADVVSRQNLGIILDRYTGQEIWNQPLVAYQIEKITKSDYLGAHPSYPSIFRVNVTAKIWWASDAVAPDEITPKFDFDRLGDEFNDYFFPGRVLRYELWLDGPVVFDENGEMTESGDILVMDAGEGDHYVGGVWKNGINPAALIHSHPDYMWRPFGLQRSTGYKNPRIDDGWVRQNIGGARN